MPFDPTLFETILAPLNPNNPSGDSLKYSSDYDAIQEARRKEEGNLPKGVWSYETKEADWARVSALCIQALCKQTKDLQLAAWLTEAWVFLEGVEGLRRGLQIIRQLTSLFWDTLHPMLETQDPSLRCAPYVWMDAKLPESLLALPISHPDKQNLGNFTFSQWLAAQHLEAMSRKQEDPGTFLQQAVENRGDPNPQMVLRSIRATPSSFYQQLRGNVLGGLDELQSLEMFLDTKFQGMPSDEIPTFFNLRKQLSHLSSLCVQWEGMTSPVISSPEGRPVEAAQLLELKEDREPAEGVLSAYSSRKERLEQLQQLATQLIQEDPHSLLSLLLEQVLTWKDKGFMDLFVDLQEDSQTFHSVLKFLSNKNKFKIN